jgi:hypothetical protein
MANYKIVILNGSKQTNLTFRERNHARALDRFRWDTQAYRLPGTMFWFFKEGKLLSMDAERFNNIGD